MESLKSSPIKLSGIYATDSAKALKEILSLLKEAGLTANVEKLADRSEDQWKNYRYTNIDEAARSVITYRSRNVKEYFVHKFIPNATVVHVSDSGETLGAIVIGIRMFKPHRKWAPESLFDNEELTINISFITTALSKTIKDDTTGFDGFLKKTNFRQLNKLIVGNRYNRYRSSRSGENSGITNPSNYFTRTCLKHTEAPNGYFTSEAVINKNVKTLSLARVANMACLFKTISNRKTKINKLGSKSTVNIAKMNVEVSIAEALNETYGKGNFDTTNKSFEINSDLMSEVKPFSYKVLVMPKIESDIKHGMDVVLKGVIDLENKKINIDYGSTHKTDTSSVTNEYGFEVKELKGLLSSSNENIVRMATELINKHVGVKEIKVKDEKGNEITETALIENPVIDISFSDTDTALHHRETSLKALVTGTNVLGNAKYAVSPSRNYFFNAFEASLKIPETELINYDKVGDIFKNIAESQKTMFNDFKKL